MKEIVISHPDINMDPFKSWSHDNPDLREAIVTDLVWNGVTPATHPKAVDLCAGDGSCAAILTSTGWNANNITCIDISRSTSPLVTGVTWQYLDLGELGWRLKGGHQIPESLQPLHHGFDVAMLWFGYLRYEQELFDFFLKPGGHASGLLTAFRDFELTP